MLRASFINQTICLFAFLILQGCGTEIGNGISFPDDPDQRTKPGQRDPGEVADGRDDSMPGGATPSSQESADPMAKESDRNSEPSVPDPNSIPESFDDDSVGQGGTANSFDPSILFAPCRNVFEFVKGQSFTLESAGEAYFSATLSNDIWVVTDAQGIDLYRFDGESVYVGNTPQVVRFDCDSDQQNAGATTTYVSASGTATGHFDESGESVVVTYTFHDGSYYIFKIVE